MDFQALKTNVTAVKTEAETLAKSAINLQHKPTLDNFIVSITKQHIIKRIVKTQIDEKLRSKITTRHSNIAV